MYTFDILLNIYIYHVREYQQVAINERSLKALDVDPEYTLRDGSCFQFVYVFALKKTDHVMHVGISE